MDIIKYKRGMVFIVYEPEDITAAKINNRERTLLKTRPYVLLSSNEYLENDRHQLYLAAPLTSKTDIFYDGDIKYMDINGEIGKISISNTKAIDRKNIREYLFTLSDSLMKVIDNVLGIMLGINSTNNVEIVPGKSEEIEKTKNINVPSTIEFLVREIKKDSPEKKENTIDSHSGKISDNVELVVTGRRTSVRIKNEKKFIEDSKNMKISDLAHYYGFKSYSACKQRLDYIQKRLSRN